MTSSFSSFPSHFSTFPDNEPGPSSRQSDSEPSREKRKQSSRTKRKERSGSREVDKERRKERERLRDKGVKKDDSREKHRRKDKERVREKDRERERDDDGGKSKHNHRDSDRFKHLSFDNLEFDRQKADVDLKKHDESFKIFFTDIKGDNLCLQYGGIYAGDVPKYRLHHGMLLLK